MTFYYSQGRKPRPQRTDGLSMVIPLVENVLFKKTCKELLDKVKTRPVLQAQRYSAFI